MLGNAGKGDALIEESRLAWQPTATYNARALGRRLGIILPCEYSCNPEFLLEHGSLMPTSVTIGPLMQPLPRDEAAQRAVDGGLKPLSQLILEARVPGCSCYIRCDVESSTLAPLCLASAVRS